MKKNQTEYVLMTPVSLQASVVHDMPRQIGSADTFVLEKGIHLHWGLPAALDLRTKENRAYFPSVPNRWMVIRKAKGKEDSYWVIESDAISFEDSTVNSTGKLGRTLSLEQWLNNEEANTSYWNTYKDLPFHPYYFLPDNQSIKYENSAQIFGFWDKDESVLEIGNLTYELVGWYELEEGGESYLDWARKKFASQETVSSFLEFLKIEEPWQIQDSTPAKEPDYLICYARIQVNPSQKPNSFIKESPKIKLTLGNHPEDALDNALLSSLVKEALPEAKTIVSTLRDLSLKENDPIDFEIHAHQNDHAKSFKPVDSGSHWYIEASQEGRSLFAKMKNQLKQLNILQTNVDHISSEHLHLAQQNTTDRKQYTYLENQGLISAEAHEKSRQSQENLLASLQKKAREIQGEMYTCQYELSQSLNDFNEKYGTDYKLKSIEKTPYQMPAPLEGILSFSQEKLPDWGRLPSENIGTIAPFDRSGDFSAWFTQMSANDPGQFLYPNPKPRAVSIHWQGSFHPIEKQQTGYSKNHIDQHYSLSLENQNLHPEESILYSNPINLSGKADFYQQSLLQWIKYLQDFLVETEEMDAWLKMKGLANDGQNSIYLDQYIEVIIEWIHSKYSSKEKALNPTHILAFEVYRKLKKESFMGLSFHDLHKNLVGNHTGSEAFDTFHPIRSGRFNLSSFSLLDVFGNVISKEIKPQAESISLPPRILQAAKLHFAWNTPEGIFHQGKLLPSLSPIRGWLLPAFSDKSLGCFDANGNLIGWIDEQMNFQRTKSIQRWSVEQVLESIYVEHPEMYVVIRYFMKQAPSFLEAYLEMLQSISQNIEPGYQKGEEQLAYLVHRPLAVTNISLSLDLLGLPAVDQSPETVLSDISLESRNSHEFEQVQFPVMLGNHLRFGDGLVGFWKTKEENESDHVEEISGESFHISSLLSDHKQDGISTDSQLLISPSEPSQEIIALVDPRGTLQASSGILPTQSLHLTISQYQKPLQVIADQVKSLPLSSPIDGSVPVFPGAGLPIISQSAWTKGMEAFEKDKPPIFRKNGGRTDFEGIKTRTASKSELWMYLPLHEHNAEDILKDHSLEPKALKGVRLIANEDEKFGYCVKFDGAYSHIELLAKPNLAFKEKEAISICFWIKYETHLPDSIERILSTDSDPNKKAFSINVESTGVMMNGFENPVALRFPNQKLLETGVWNHFSFVFSGEAIFIYVNGELLSQPLPVQTIRYGEEWKIGYGNILDLNEAAFFSGKMSGVRIYKGVKSLAQIHAIMGLDQLEIEKPKPLLSNVQYAK